jgi:hypothetical protein
MHQLHDAEIAKRLLHHLARAFGCPDAVYLAVVGARHLSERMVHERERARRSRIVRAFQA